MFDPCQWQHPGQPHLKGGVGRRGGICGLGFKKVNVVGVEVSVGLGSQEGEEPCQLGGVLCSGSQESNRKVWAGPAPMRRFWKEPVPGSLGLLAQPLPTVCLGPLSVPRGLFSFIPWERLRPSQGQLWDPPQARHLLSSPPLLHLSSAPNRRDAPH